MGIMDIEDAQSIEGEGEAREKVERFILNILESVELEGEYVFHLYNQGRGNDEEDPVFTSECEGSKKQEVRIVRAQELANEIVEAAIEDVENFLKGKYKYAVRCDDVKARCVFTLKVNPTEDEDMDDVEETPSKKGILSQLMRHQEKIMKVAVGSVKNVIEMQHKSIRDKDERIRQLEEKQVETIRITEDLVSGQHARNLELRKLEKKDKRADELLGMVMQGAPLLLQMVAASGKKGEGEPQAEGQAHESPTPSGEGGEVENIVETFLGTMDEEQLLKIQQSGIFKPEQLMLLIQLARAVDAQRQAKQKTGNS